MYKSHSALDIYRVQALKKVIKQEEKWISQVVPWGHVFVLEIYIQSTVFCWESQLSSTGTAVHLGSGSQPNASHEYLCQLQQDCPVSFLNATCQHFQQCLPRECRLTDSVEDTSTANSLHSFHLWDWLSIIVCDVRKCCVISACICHGLNHKVIM